jgi:hypothetical protein
VKLREDAVPVMPEHLAVYDVDAPCASCGALHAFDRDDVLARYHAIVAASAWRRRHGVTGRHALPTPRRVSAGSSGA